MDRVEGAHLNKSLYERHRNEGNKYELDSNHGEHIKGGLRRNHTHDSAVVKLLTNYSHAVIRWACRLIMDAPRLLTELHIQDSIKEIRILLSNHPWAAVIFSFMAVACGIPILIFVAFAVITIFFTFGGFLVIEGAVLAAGSFALLLCLATMAVVFITISFIGGLLYVTYMQVESMVRLNFTGGDQMPFDSRLPQILASLRDLPYTNRHSHAHAHATHSPQSSQESNGHMQSHKFTTD